jgi:hypothetical protein
MERHRDPKHNRRTTAQTREESYAKSLSAQQSEEEEDFVQETPEAALVAAQAYLLTTQPEPGDPREHMHQAAIQSLGLIEDKLMENFQKKRQHIVRKGEKKSSSASPRKTNPVSHQVMRGDKNGKRTQET